MESKNLITRLTEQSSMAFFFVVSYTKNNHFCATTENLGDKIRRKNYALRSGVCTAAIPLRLLKIPKIDTIHIHVSKINRWQFRPPNNLYLGKWRKNWQTNMSCDSEGFHQRLANVHKHTAQSKRLAVNEYGHVTEKSITLVMHDDVIKWKHFPRY